MILLKAGSISYRLCQDACECVCLFQTILNNGKFTKYPSRFEDESNRNLSGDFTISIEDAICIALSKQDDYCRSRPCTTSEETVMELLFHRYRSSRYIIWRSSYRYYLRGRYKFMHREKTLCLADNYVRREDFMPRQNLYITRRIYASLEFMHRGIHASRNHASRVNNHA